LSAPASTSSVRNGYTELYLALAHLAGRCMNLYLALVSEVQGIPGEVVHYLGDAEAVSPGEVPILTAVHGERHRRIVSFSSLLRLKPAAGLHG